MKQAINISLEFEIVIGKVNLNEITYRLKEIQNPLMLKILERILRWYDDLIADRLSQPNSGKARKGLGRHTQKSDSKNRFCPGRKVRKRGYRKHSRKFTTIFGPLKIPIRVVECCHCGAFYSPLLSALSIGRYSRKEGNFEHEVIEAVISAWRMTVISPFLAAVA